MVNEELEQTIHISVIADYQVYVTVLKLQGDALPAVERQLFDLSEIHRVEMLPEHPEARVDTAIDDALDGGHVAAGAAFEVFKMRADFKHFIIVTYFALLVLKAWLTD